MRRLVGTVMVGAVGGVVGWGESSTNVSLHENLRLFSLLCYFTMHEADVPIALQQVVGAAMKWSVGPVLERAVGWAGTARAVENARTSSRELTVRRHERDEVARLVAEVLAERDRPLLVAEG